MSLDWVLAPERVMAAAALVLGYAGLCARTAWATRARKQAFLRDSQALAARSPHEAATASVLVTFASQTGQAEGLAREAAKMLAGSGLQVQLLPVDQLSDAALRTSKRSLWVLSTTGEGDAPDHALHFVQGLLQQSVDLGAHQSQVLALGDREYQQFCGFGVQVHDWLTAQGATSQLICVDNMDRGTLQRWQSGMNGLKDLWLGHDVTAAPASPEQDNWLMPPVSVPLRLAGRSLLNPGSSGGPLYLLDWEPVTGTLPEWRSGDLVSLTVPAEPDRPRDYSIASIPQDGRLQLLVRESRRADGSVGAASGWLCGGMQEGETLALSTRAHSGFQLGVNAERPLILIGNGSGFAGLRSHIRARVAQGRGDQWLIFGERSPQHDAIFSDELTQWLAGGGLERVDLAWSRDTARPRYVQDVLRENAALLSSWLASDAAIYVCGSQQGMAQGVHEVLVSTLGEASVEALTRAGRYRRDVY